MLAAVRIPEVHEYVFVAVDVWYPGPVLTVQLALWATLLPVAQPSASPAIHPVGNAFGNVQSLTSQFAEVSDPVHKAAERVPPLAHNLHVSEVEPVS